MKRDPRPSTPLDFASADAVGRRWLQGDFLSPSEKIRRFAGEIEEALVRAYDKGSYPVLRQVRAYLEERKFPDNTPYTADIDPAIVEQIRCEYECGAQCWDDRWGIEQDCFVACLSLCNPYRPPEEPAPAPTASRTGELQGFLDMGLATKTSTSPSSDLGLKSGPSVSGAVTSPPATQETG